MSDLDIAVENILDEDDDVERKRNRMPWIEKIVGNFDPVINNLFASRVNCKVNRYYSYNLEPEAIGIDVFSYCWSNETFYAFPPFSIISKVLSKIEAEMATGVLIFPLFTIHSWFILGSYT